MSRLESRAARHARKVNDHHRELERDCTPRPLIAQLIEASLDELEPLDLIFGQTVKVLDGWAGAGPWGSEVRCALARRRRRAHITAIDINPAELCHLKRWADVALIDDVTEALHPNGYDWIVANPAFSAVPPNIRRGQRPEQSIVPRLLAAAPVVLLLHRVDLLSRGQGGQWLAEHCPPVRVWLVGGTIKFRVGINPDTGGTWGGDKYSYAGYLWVRGHSGPWRSSVLPRLTAAQRSWTVRPGTEPPEVARALGLMEAGDE